MYTLEKPNPEYDEQTLLDVFDAAARIVQYNRPWFYRQVTTHSFHPIVKAAMKLIRPHDWQQLLLEWPHRAESDPNKVAFTRDERSGEADRVVVTSMGKYLMRHFNLPDHYIRDLVAMHTQGEETMKLVHTIEEMVHAVQYGPKSCMQWPDPDETSSLDHPYTVYNPKYGWHMAVRIEHDGVICGRALCMDDGEHKWFVRSYKRDREGGYSHADERLEAWLRGQGYLHECGWDGCMFSQLPGSPFLAPYLDGDYKGVVQTRDRDGQPCLRIVHDSDAEWMCNGTDGEPEDHGGRECEDCGDRYDEDNEGGYVGRYEDRGVCQCCLDNNYTHVNGRRGDAYYVHNDEAVEVNGDFYDVNYLSDNNIVALHDGDYAELDDCVMVDNEWYLSDDDDIVEIDDTWYRKDDENIVECSDGEYRLRDECFQCPSCSEWHARELADA